MTPSPPTQSMLLTGGVEQVHSEGPAKRLKALRLAPNQLNLDPLEFPDQLDRINVFTTLRADQCLGAHNGGVFPTSHDGLDPLWRQLTAAGRAQFIVSQVLPPQGWRRRFRYVPRSYIAPSSRRSFSDCVNASTVASMTSSLCDDDTRNARPPIMSTPLTSIARLIASVFSVGMVE